MVKVIILVINSTPQKTYSIDQYTVPWYRLRYTLQQFLHKQIQGIFTIQIVKLPRIDVYAPTITQDHNVLYMMRCQEQLMTGDRQTPLHNRIPPPPASEIHPVPDIAVPQVFRFGDTLARFIEKWKDGVRPHFKISAHFQYDDDDAIYLFLLKSGRMGFDHISNSHPISNIINFQFDLLKRGRTGFDPISKYQPTSNIINSHIDFFLFFYSTGLDPSWVPTPSHFSCGPAF